MRLWTRITQGLAALMLSAAALALLLLSGALLLGFAALALLVAGGIWLAAPDEARRSIGLIGRRIDLWIEAMRGIVEDAGALLRTVIERQGAGEPREDAGAERSGASESDRRDPSPDRQSGESGKSASQGTPSAS